MKQKQAACVLALLVVIGFSLGAQEEGYSGPGLEPVSVEEAKTLRDDTPVSLQGKIERFLGNDKYLFTDDSGSITIEIEKRLWRGLSVSQDDMVEIIGEIDKDFRIIEVEVSDIKKI
jgi:uncharacterized protein (TIGR00156 family)